MVEDTQVHSTSTNAAGQKEEKQVETLAKVEKWENVRQPGSDVKKGDLVLEKGTVLRSAGGEIGTLAFVGKTKVGAGKLGVAGLWRRERSWRSATRS